MSTKNWVIRVFLPSSIFSLGAIDMRKIVTLSTVVAASLMVAACGGSQPAATDNAAVTEMNAAVTEMNAADAMEGTTNDAMTNVDGAMGADANMAADANAAMPAADANATAPAVDAMAADKNAAAPVEEKK
jgi:hypothetical protein